jgi:hypothetical protein
MSEPFKVHNFSTIDKWIDITGPEGLSIRVDYDDVAHKSVENATKKMVDLLNNHWNEYAGNAIMAHRADIRD